MFSYKCYLLQFKLNIQNILRLGFLQMIEVNPEILSIFVIFFFQNSNKLQREKPMIEAKLYFTNRSVFNRDAR